VNDRSGARSSAVGVLAFLLFGWPFLSVFDVPSQVLGVPVLWAYLLTAWLAVIGLLAVLTRDG
jgi:hypothetical protein